MNQGTRHPDPETLAAFAEGRRDGLDVAAIVEHLDVCEDCMHEVSLAMEEAKAAAEASRFRRPAAIAAIAAAAVLIAFVSIPAARQLVERTFRTSPTARLVALAPSTSRAVEPRLTGGFAWAEYHGPARAAEEAANAQQLKLGGVAGELVERADRDRDAQAEHAAGVALLLVRKPADALPRLEAAATAANDAKTWSDLAAARHEAASSLGRASLEPAALAAADTALRLDPKLAEALFNRALILERMGLAAEARRAWQRYLAVDASSRWAAEARAHLAELPASTPSARFERDRPLIEAAAVAGDARRVRELVDLHRERARAWAEGEYLGQWGEALQRGDGAAAARALTAARAIGDALAALSGELLVRDAVRAIDGADATARASIAKAHVDYRAARIAYSRHQIEAAERGLREAAAEFDTVHDPMALPARYFAAGARLAQNDVAGARAELEQARLEADAHPAYASLGAHVRWELARALVHEDEWSEALPLFMDAEARFHAIGERAPEAVVAEMAAVSLTELGRADEAWAARLRAFAALSAEGDAEYLAINLAGAMRSELQTGRRDCALALSALQRDAVAEGGVRPVVVVDTLIERSMVESLTGDASAALKTSSEAGEAARALPDAALRERELADVDVVRGAALSGSDPRGAAAALTRAIDFYRAWLPAALREPLLLRARGSLRRGDAVAAARDLDEGMAVIEQHPSAEGAGTGILDADHAIFDEAIRLRLERGDDAGAFAVAERARGSAITVPELQRRLAGSGAAVLEIVALPDEIVTFAIGADRFAVARRAHGSATYDDVVAPAEEIVGRARSLVIAPDARFDGVSFAALRGARGGRYLVERLPVAIAKSAGSLQTAERNANERSLGAIALPSGGGTAALPDAERELAGIAALYRRAVTIPPARAAFASLGEAGAADVLHIAGHTEREPGGGEQALVFADRHASWKAIAAAPRLRARTVVLAACETFRVPPSPQTRAMSLAAAFSAAGADDVIGTLAPIPDRDALELFRAVHRGLARGASAAEAVRAAQLESIANERAGNGARAWQSIAVLTRRVPAP